MTVYNIPYDQATDPRALFAQGIQNLVAGMIEANQAKIEGREISRIAGALPENHPLRVALSRGPIRSPALRRGMMVNLGQSLGTQGVGVLPGWWNMASPEQKQGYLNRVGGQETFGTTPRWLQGDTEEETRENLRKYRERYFDRASPTPTPLTEPQVSAYGEAMDSRIKRVDRFRPGFKDFKEDDLFREWQKFVGMYQFKNDTQREQVWNTWKNKLNNLGGELDWDPTDPKWREAIGLSAETSREIGPGSVKLQSAPDIALDPYWDELTDEEKKTAWEHIDAGGSVEDIINLLK